jgi:hypothetical protein
MKHAPAVLLIVFFAYSGHAAAEGDAREPNDFGKLAKNVLQSAEMGTNADFDKFKTGWRIAPEIVAPKGFHQVLVDADAKRRSRLYFHFRAAPRHLILTWSVDVRIEADENEAAKTWSNALQRAGYHDRHGTVAPALAAAFKEMDEALPKPPDSDGSSPRTYGKLSGSTLEAIRFPAVQGLVGGRVVSSGTEVMWCLIHRYDGPPPTVEELWTAVPSLSPMFHEKPLIDRLKREPAFEYVNDCTLHDVKGMNLGWSLKTNAKVRADVEAILAQEKFVSRDKALPIQNYRGHGAAEQFMWRRDADSTTASLVIPAKDKSVIGVGCQSPQRPVDKLP